MEFKIEKAIERILSKLNAWLDTFVSMIPNMAVSVIIILVFVVLAKIGKKIFRRLFRKASDNQALENLFATILYYSILGLGIFLILGVLRLDKAVTSLLAGIGVVGLALGFAFQDIAANFVSGVILAFRTPFLVDEVVQIKGVMGRISRTNLRVTVIKTFQGQEVYIPNKDVLQGDIMNFSKLGKRRIDLSVGISYGDDLQKVEDLVTSTITGLEGVIDHENMIFDYEAFGDSSINFNIRFWINYPEQSFIKMRSQAIKAIKAAFDKNDITIPFPIRTLDFGIKGGTTLAETPIMLNENRRNGS